MAQTRHAGSEGGPRQTSYDHEVGFKASQSTYFPLRFTLRGPVEGISPFGTFSGTVCRKPVSTWSSTQSHKVNFIASKAYVSVYSSLYDRSSYFPDTPVCISAHTTVFRVCLRPVMESKLADTHTSSDSDIVIGVLALQGAFREHIAHFSKVAGVTALEVRKREDLDGLDGLVIPGGVCLPGKHNRTSFNDPLCDVYSGPQVCLCEHLHSSLHVSLGRAMF